MKIWNEISEFRAKNPVATIGIFDGVHQGHKYLIRELIKKAKNEDGESVIITLWPHPRYVLGKETDSLRYLNTLEEKIILLENEGVDHLIIIPFTKEFSELSSCEFISDYLVNKFKIKHLLIGYNHRFGKDRQGDAEILQTCTASHDFNVIKLDPLEKEGERVSSSLIRNLLFEGKLEEANKALDYPYFLLGKIVAGNKVGRELGFRTANIQIEDKNKLLPKIGVYAVYLSVESKLYPGMLNIGYRPTVDGENSRKSIEVHLFEFQENIYGKKIALAFRKYMRNEVKFNSIEELKKQLVKDKIEAEKILKI